jgi:hypothetical protein
MTLAYSNIILLTFDGFKDADGDILELKTIGIHVLCVPNDSIDLKLFHSLLQVTLMLN